MLMKNVLKRGGAVGLLAFVILWTQFPVKAEEKSLKQQLEEAKAAIADQVLIIEQMKDDFFKVTGQLEAEIKKLRATTAEQAREIARRAKEQMEFNKRLQGDIASLQGDVTGLRGDVTTLKGMRRDVASLREYMAYVKRDMGSLKEKVGGLEELARQTQEKTDLLFSKLNDLEKRVRALERLVGKKPNNVD